MIAKFLTVVLPLALPFLIYGLYLAMIRRRARLAGEGQLPGWEDAPWLWIIVSGAVLLALALGTYRMSTGVAPGSKIEPPRLIDGKVEPSRVVE